MKTPIAALLVVLILSCNHNSTVTSITLPDTYYENIAEQAAALMNKGLTNEAFNFIDSVYASANQPGDAGKMNKYLFYCSVYSNRLQDVPKTFLYADSMLMLINNSKDPLFKEKYEATANFSMGDAQFAMKKYDHAYKYYYTAKLIASSKNNYCALNDYSYRLGIVLYKQEHFATAAQYFKMSLFEAGFCNSNFFSFYRKQELLSNTALSYSKCGETDSALHYFTKALNLVNEEIKLPVNYSELKEIARGVIYGNMAQVYVVKGQYQTAAALFNKSIAINNKNVIGFEVKDAQFAQLNLADLYIKTGDTKKTLPILNEVRNYLDTLPNNEIEVRWTEGMYKYYDATGNRDRAFAYLKNFLALKNSITEGNKSFRETDVKELVQNLGKQYQIEALQKSNKINRYYSAGATVIALMAIIIIALVYLNIKRAKRSVEKLTILNADIKDKKEKLSNTLDELEKQSKEKDRILRMVAHDLRSPISGIAGLAGLLQDEKNDVPNYTVFFGLIKSTCNDALQLINEILEASGFAEVKHLSKQPTNLKSMLTNTISLLQFNAAEKQQKIILEAEDAGKDVMINKEKMTRVISNLISNSIKFSPVNEAIYVKTSSSNNAVLISIRDKGIGIPASMAHSVFDMFTTSKRPGTSGEKSFGLGLSICRQIVEAHNGKIWFESEDGNGTTFHVQLNYN